MEKIKVNDEVIVLAGKDKGKTGKVKSVNRKTSRVVVEGVNVVKKSMKASQQSPDGGFFNKEIPLHISNVALMSPKTRKATRVKIQVKDDKRVRVAAKCGTQL